jgi:FlaA1/EpsC-like NDP-sugar epimerase
LEAAGWVSGASAGGKRVLIAGAGHAAQLAARELLSNPQLDLDPIGFVDDDASKHDRTLVGLPIFGSISAIPGVARAHFVDEILIAIPSAHGRVIRNIVRLSQDAGVPTRILPGLFEILSGRVAISQLRNVEIQDLLRREPVRADFASVNEVITNKTVMVTGAGGSIGSELCRQIASMNPRRLVLLGHGENSIFEILMELAGQFPGMNLTPVIADVRDRRRVHEVMDRWRPEVVFHAAAHKHVPLMEENVIEAVTNNVVGTQNMVDASIYSDVERFVLISTDKAVRPTSIMGATKRIAEQIVQLAALAHDRNFVSVRFGNVLGSRGSVVPMFLRQIRQGGPVTVTHPEMRRFFMTIPEAVQLVLQAGSLGNGAEVFALDMGEPIRVLDLANDLIRLSGLEPDKDIEILFTGMRPGEKLYEELFFSGEDVLPTTHPKIRRARHLEVSHDTQQHVRELINAAESAAGEGELRDLIAALVPELTRERVNVAPGGSMGAPRRSSGASERIA